MAVAAGPAKVPVVRAALRSGLCSVLITDEPTATAVLAQAAKAGGMT
ncbi:MAG TPA: sugar-binding domain-containing protein [Candidatus Limnocylindria bacterium]|nr:sugar-binding domain-containing protein [Candidatus Limnocylindria bacterium]